MERPRSANAIVVRALSVLLAAVFVAAGLSKLTSAGSLGLEAAAMHEFPAWIRAVVGVVEIAAGLALLVPGLAVVAALVLAFLMVPATLTQYVSGEPGTWIPALLLVLLVVVAWRRAPERVSGEWRRLAATPRPVLREGVVAGLIGATTIAVWFFVVDLIAGRPLFTPETLGRSLLSILGPAPAGESTMLYVAAYTLVHYAAFAAVGILAAGALQAARREPSLLLGFVILFVAFEVGFHAVVGLLEETTPLGALAWWQVMAGNLLAATAMGIYLWRAHPALREQFSHALEPGA